MGKRKIILSFKFIIFIYILSLFLILSAIAYLTYGLKPFGYDTPKYIYQIKIIKKYGFMLIIPHHVRQNLLIKFNYIYLVSLASYYLSKLLNISIIYAIPAFSVLVLVPLYGITIFILALLLLQDLADILNRRLKIHRILLITLSTVCAMASIYSINIVYLATHLFRQFFAIILFNILTIFLIYKLKSNTLFKKYDLIIIIILIIMIFMNQIESAIFTMIYIIFFSLVLIHFEKDNIYNIGKQLFKFSLLLILLSVFITIVSIALDVKQIEFILISALKGFLYYYSVPQASRPLPIIIYRREHNLAIDILGGNYFSINLFILTILVFFFISNLLSSRKRMESTFSPIFLPLCSLLLFIYVFAFLLPIPWVFQARVLMFLPLPLYYVCFGYFLFLNKYRKSFLNILLAIFIILSLLLFNSIYSYKLYLHKWTRPYIDIKVINYVSHINDLLCSNNSYIIYVMYLPNYKYWEFSYAWLYRNWIYALTDCMPLIFYGKVYDLIHGINTLYYRKIDINIYNNFRDIINQLIKLNDKTIKMFNKDRAIPIVLVKNLYMGNDVRSLKGVSCSCAYKGCSLIICQYAGSN